MSWWQILLAGWAAVVGIFLAALGYQFLAARRRRRQRIVRDLIIYGDGNNLARRVDTLDALDRHLDREWRQAVKDSRAGV